MFIITADLTEGDINQAIKLARANYQSVSSWPATWERCLPQASSRAVRPASPLVTPQWGFQSGSTPTVYQQRKSRMSNAAIAYIAAAFFGLLAGWFFAVPLREILDASPRDNPVLWMMVFCLGSPAAMWLFKI